MRSPIKILTIAVFVLCGMASLSAAHADEYLRAIYYLLLAWMPVAIAGSTKT